MPLRGERSSVAVPAFRRLPDADPRPEVVIDVDGVAVVARDGDSVAAAMLLAGVGPFRASAVSGEPRAPFCGVGACFECAIEIDGVANRRACLTPVRHGQRVRRRGLAGSDA